MLSIGLDAGKKVMNRKTETNESALSQPPTLTPHGIEYASASLSAADAMHAELLSQCERLMDAEAETKAAEDLERLSKLVEDYEQARWPLE